jgi:hypothetical protein
MDDPALKGYNVPDLVNQYVQAMYDQADAIQGNDVMSMAGSDFNYKNSRYVVTTFILLSLLGASGRNGQLLLLLLLVVITPVSESRSLHVVVLRCLVRVSVC